MAYNVNCWPGLFVFFYSLHCNIESMQTLSYNQIVNCALLKIFVFYCMAEEEFQFIEKNKE